MNTSKKIPKNLKLQTSPQEDKATLHLPSTGGTRHTSTWVNPRAFVVADPSVPDEVIRGTHHFRNHLPRTMLLNGTLSPKNPWNLYHLHVENL